VKRFIICLGAVCFGCLPVVCPGQATQAGDDADRGTKQDQMFVSGYGHALEFLTEELLHLARTDRLLVVWLFDESESMRDDQFEVTTNVGKMHAEIHDKLQSLDRNNNTQEAIQYCVYSFGSSTHAVFESPSSDPDLIAMSRGDIPREESGEEKTFHAVGAVIGKTATLAAKTNRRPVLILVTDESGDDDNDKLLEAAVSRVQRANAPVYVLGREATFGQPYGRVRWTDPKFRLQHWLKIRRGPESALIESLQWDGLNTRTDTQSAGCGPYALVRLAKASGGAYLILPGSEAEAPPFGPSSGPRGDSTLLPEKYQPSYESRLEYLLKTTQSPFRLTLQETIREFDAASDSQLSIRVSGYPVDEAEFQKEAETQSSKIRYAHRLLEKSFSRLEEIRNLREQETSPRWRAHYDLIDAQLAVYRIRLEQVPLAMDRLVATNPSLNNDENSCWILSRVRKKPIIPNEAQYARLKSLLKLTTTREEYLDRLDADIETARQLLQDVIDRHPHTPWGNRARYELNLGFGMMFRRVQRPPAMNQKTSLPRL